jgi:Domain of unknown function (DUF5664)
MRKNSGKPRLGKALLMPNAIGAIVSVVVYGEEKYGPAEDKGWLKYEFHETIDSLMRHLTDLKNGTTHDAESGLPAVNHVLFNAAVLVEITSYCSSGDLLGQISREDFLGP